MAKVGFIGLGIMGKPIVMNMLKANIDVTVYDINPAVVEECRKAGAKTAASAKELATGKDVVMSIVPNAKIVFSLLQGDDGVLAGVHEGTVIIDMSSVTPGDSQGCAKLCAEKGCPFLDAPVSGGEEGAIKGTLSIMVGGDEQVLDSVRPVFAAIGSSAVYIGPNGSGSVTKLANQIMVNVNIAAVAEALVLAQKAGADPKRVFEAVRGGLAGSRVLEDKAPRMFNRNFVPGGSLTTNLKDITNVMDTAKALEVPLFLSGSVQQIMLSLKAHGHIGDDHSGMVQFYENIAGVEVHTEEK